MFYGYGVMKLIVDIFFHEIDMRWIRNDGR